MGRKKHLGSVISERRRSLGLSQEGLADLCGLHRTYISQVERGLKSPTLRVLSTLAENLNARPSELLRELEEPG